MLRRLLERFFGRASGLCGPQPEQLAYQVGGTFPAGPLPPHKVACVLRRGELVITCRDNAPKMEDGEVCWLLPAEDETVSVTLELADERTTTDVTTRFEADPSIAVLLRDRKELTKDDLAALITSELAGLVDLLGHERAESMIELDEAARERLRAKLSLLLQTKGLRCTGIGPFRPVPTEASVEEDPEPVDGARAVPPEANLAERVGAAELEPALAAAIGRVKTDEQWDDLIGELEAGGMELDEESVASLDGLGVQVVDCQTETTRAAKRICEMAESASRRARIQRPDLRRWHGLALRLRALDVGPEESEPETPTPAVPGVPRMGRLARRPWTWWMLRRSSIDDRLQRFLKPSVGQTRALLDQYRGGLQEVTRAARIKHLTDRMRLVEDLLETVPTLTPRQRQFRPDRKRVKELVKSIERAVTSAEMVQAQARALVEQPEASPAWRDALADAGAAVEMLAEHLRARREVR